jgi:hypothetical protein
MSATKITVMGFGVAVLIAAVPIFLEGHHTAAYVMIGIAVVIFIIASLIHEPPGSPKSTSITQTANPTLTANPTINVNVSPQVPPAIPSATPPKADRPKPNIITFPSKVRPVAIKREYGFFFDTGVTEFSRSDRAALAYYGNQPQEEGQQIGPANSVRANIIYKDESGQELHNLRVRTGYWLDVSGNTVDFPPLADHALIVALKTDEGFCVLYNPNEEYVNRQDYVRSTYFTQTRLTAEVKFVTRDGHTLKVFRYALVTAADEFSIQEVS